MMLAGYVTRGKPCTLCGPHVVRLQHAAQYRLNRQWFKQQDVVWSRFVCGLWAVWHAMCACSRPWWYLS